ncbi:MAG: ATP-binding cassette domain-containing protein, partial [Anaerolineae bacterium]|nr:ATP-binding cassette domain-containing protein [Anaerolineae bacterium]
MHTEIIDIHKYFGTVRANDGITFSLEPGKIYGILGENGAGKSTLMKIISGYQPADKGKILLDGETANFSSPADALKTGIGMLYQDPLDFPPFRIVDNYLLGRQRGVRLGYANAKKVLQELTERYNFEVDINAYVDTLSLGERQQLELVRLLAGGAELLILDEPTTGISGDQKDVLFATMQTLAEDGKTLVLVSHKLDEVQELCSQVFVLKRGKLVGETDVPCSNEKLVELMFEDIPARKKRPEVKFGGPLLELNDLEISTYKLKISDINLS